MEKIIIDETSTREQLREALDYELARLASLERAVFFARGKVKATLNRDIKECKANTIKFADMLNGKPGASIQRMSDEQLLAALLS